MDMKKVVSIMILSNNAYYAYNGVPNELYACEFTFGISPAEKTEDGRYYRGEMEKYELSDATIPTDLILNFATDA